MYDLQLCLSCWDMNMNMNNGFVLESVKCNGAATRLSELTCLYHYVYIMQMRAQEPDRFSV